MSDGVKLKACPLCGREPEINRHAVFQIHCTQTYPGQHIVCVTERTEAEAIAAWNTRKSDDGWRTMESAPKDGSSILAIWQYDPSDPTKGSETHEVVRWCGWWDGNGFTLPEPSHWRPLPSPPEG